MWTTRMEHFLHCAACACGLALLASESFAAPEPALWKRVEQAYPVVLKDLATLVNIDAPSDDGAAVARVQDRVADWLRELGARVEKHPAPGGAYNLVATLQGSGKGKVLLIAHADTVFKRGSATAHPFRIDKGRAYGPGVADERSGIVAGLHALKLLKASGFQRFAKITFVVNCDEEIGSRSSRELIMQLARSHDYALCLERGRPGDGVMVTRRGGARLIVEVQGKAAHAGAFPPRGANALLELAHQVLQLSRLADPHKGTSVSFTVFKAGDKLNVIPDHAEARADVRYQAIEELERIERAVKVAERQQLVAGTKVRVTVTPGRPPFVRSAKNDALLARANHIYQELSSQLLASSAGGSSDANYTAFVGTPSLDGLAFVGGRGHTDKEYLELSSVSRRLYLLTRLLMELGSRP